MWSTKKLGEISTLFNGTSINEQRKKENYEDLDCGTSYVATKDISYEGKIDYETGVKIPDSDKNLFKMAPANSVLICAEGGSAGRKIAYSDRDIFFGNKLYALVPGKLVYGKFVFYFYLTDVFLKLFKSQMSGLIGGVSINKFKEIEIPLPPIDEQKRIVGILDEVFEGVAKAKENVEGNLRNVREVFEAYLQSVFADCNDGGKKRKIEEVAKVINGFSFSSKDFSPKNKIKSVKITNVGVEEFVEEESNFLPEEYLETYKDYQVQEGNIVIALTRTIIAAGLKVAVIPKSYNGALLNQRVAALDPIKNLIDQRFLYNFLCTTAVTNYVKSNVNTLMQPNLSINDLKKLLVPCPSISEQKSIVTKLDALSTETKKLEAIYKTKLNHLEELKKSILKKAFNGEL